jgi:Glycosyl hydrolases family 39
MKITKSFALLVPCLALLSVLGTARATETPIRIAPEWGKVVGLSKASITIQVCPEPPMRRGQPLHDPLFAALKGLEANYARLSPWYPYPQLAVAELKPPADGRTFWDFTMIDQIAEDFMAATAGHPVVFNLGTIPRWMFDTKSPTRYPENAGTIDWTYNDDTALSVTTIQQFADYQARLAGWYMNGGLTDELGQWHESGHHYKIDYWEVLNEPDVEHGLTPLQYTQIYDAVVSAVRKVAPQLKFAGPALANTVDPRDYFIYFLDPKNHQAGVPIDMVSYHFYTMPDADETSSTMDYTIFQQADKFLTAARYIDVIRRHFSPSTLTAVNELGSMLPGPFAPRLTRPIPNSYWIRAGAMWAYVYGHLAALGVDVVGAAELIDYPGQVAASTLVNWDTGRPNARYWVAKLLRDNFGPGDQLIKPLPESDEINFLPPSGGDDMNSIGPSRAIQIYAQAFVSSHGDQKVLLINKRDRPIQVTIPGAAGGNEQSVDETTDSQPVIASIATDTILLRGLSVTVVTLSKR